MTGPLTWREQVLAPLLMVVPMTGFSTWALWATVALWETSFPAWWAGLLAGFLAGVCSGTLCLSGLKDFDVPLLVVELALWVTLLLPIAGALSWVAAFAYGAISGLGWALLPVGGMFLATWMTTGIFRALCEED